jgi:hypothetical protein
MQSSFRPVALRLSLSDVAALAAATARGFVDRWRRDRPLALALRLRLRSLAPLPKAGWTDAAALPDPRRDSELD